MSGFTQLSAILERGGDKLFFECPGCKMVHGVRVEGPHAPKWSWNGSVDNPTFRPSVLVRYPWRLLDNGEREQVTCHSFITDGQIQFLDDCTHALAGQTVPLPPLEDYE